MKSSEVCYQNKVTPALLPTQGQDTKHTTIKWAISDKRNYLCFIVKI